MRDQMTSNFPGESNEKSYIEDEVDIGKIEMETMKVYWRVIIFFKSLSLPFVSNVLFIVFQRDHWQNTR